jgi:hypothetical protein
LQHREEIGRVLVVEVHVEGKGLWACSRRPARAANRAKSASVFTPAAPARSFAFRFIDLPRHRLTARLEPTTGWVGGARRLRDQSRSQVDPKRLQVLHWKT